MFSLIAPVLEFNLQDVEKQSCREKIKEILRFWLSVDRNNLTDVMVGTRDIINCQPSPGRLLHGCGKLR